MNLRNKISKNIESNYKTIMWMDNIETKITKFKMFELKKNTTLKVLITYVNNNEIVEIKKHKMNLKQKNCISKEELANLLINNKTNSNITYNSYRIMKFNLNLEPMELENFLEKELLQNNHDKEDSNNNGDDDDDDDDGDDDNNDDDDNEYESFTNNYNNLVDVKLDDSINMFEDLNMIMIILQKRKPSQNQTRKKPITIKQQNVKHIACNIKNRRTKKFLNLN